jgi:hypothetical protein
MDNMFNPHDGTCLDPLAVANNQGFTSTIDAVSPFPEGSPTDQAWKHGHELAHTDRYK